ncbi:MAG TPA: FAD-binding oxidoreductase [Beijerinckiaceae bacterium]|jgi:D-amino-acid dehydrogenase
MRADVVVLGAGIVGVSVAVHLQKRGRAVLLVDREAPGLGTSFGNTGLIQREAVYPYSFPRSWREILRHGRNRSIDTHYDWRALPRLAPFLVRYWWHSGTRRHAEIARKYAPLIERCVPEHLELAREAEATALLRPGGWIKIFRTPSALEERVRAAELWAREFGIEYAVLDPRALAEKEPHLDPALIGGLHFPEPVGVRDPHALTVAYVGLLERLGGAVAVGEATSLEQARAGWRVATAKGPVEVPDVVVALGAWSDVVIGPLGYRLPLGVKRGYHMHYRPAGNAVLNHTVLDAETGYALAPMARGIRLTTGAEFASRDAPKTPVQLERAEPVAKRLFPLGERLDPEPWMGVRPCTPDMLPVIGKAPRHNGLWLAFGHAHHGLTLGPVTGRLLAEMMTGEEPSIDPAPYRADRF